MCSSLRLLGSAIPLATFPSKTTRSEPARPLSSNRCDYISFDQRRPVWRKVHGCWNQSSIPVEVITPLDEVAFSDPRRSQLSTTDREADCSLANRGAILPGQVTEPRDERTRSEDCGRRDLGRRFHGPLATCARLSTPRFRRSPPDPMPGAPPSPRSRRRHRARCPRGPRSRGDRRGT